MKTLEEYILQKMMNRKFALTFIEESLKQVKDEDGREMLAHGLITLAKAHGITLIEIPE